MNKDVDGIVAAAELWAMRTIVNYHMHWKEFSMQDVCFMVECKLAPKARVRPRTSNTGSTGSKQ